MPEQIMSRSPYNPLRKVLTECAGDGAYRETCRRIVGNETYGDPDILSDLWAKLRAEPNRYLANDDLDQVFSRTHYGSYWTRPKHVDVDGQKISLNEAKLKGNVEEQCWKLVAEVFPKLKSMEVTSVILGCVHPDHFGVYSHPILMLLRIPIMTTPVNHYLKYCHELRDWGKQFLPGRSVLDTDRALWVFHQDAYGHRPDKDKMTTYRESFDRDDWVRERHARNLLHPYFSSYLPLQQARFLLNIDANTSARIVGCEFEARIQELVDPDEGERGRKIRDFIDSHPALKPKEWLRAMVEYVVQQKLSSVPDGDLQKVRKDRNDAIHMRRDFNNRDRWGKSGKSDVETMIRVTEALPKQSRSRK
jgi:hypothetical protein